MRAKGTGMRGATRRPGEAARTTGPPAARTTGPPAAHDRAAAGGREQAGSAGPGTIRRPAPLSRPAPLAGTARAGTAARTAPVSRTAGTAPPQTAPDRPSRTASAPGSRTAPARPSRKTRGRPHRGPAGRPGPRPAGHPAPRPDAARADAALRAAACPAPRPEVKRPLAARPQAAHPAPAVRSAGQAAPLPPFVLLVVGLLSGGLICLLLLNTVLAAGTFRMTSLQQANAALARQHQALQQQVLYSESPAAIAKRARKLGMFAVSQPRFVNLKSGRIYERPAPAVSRTGN